MLHAGLKRAGFEAVLLETRHVKAALSAMTVKTDRKDGGLAQLIRMGWFRPVHAKSIRSQEVRALLVARKQLLRRLIDVELSIRGILRGFGLKVGSVTRKGFDARVRELVKGQPTSERIAEAMLSARAALKAEYEKLHETGLAIVRDDAVCRRLMTVPSVGSCNNLQVDALHQRLAGGDDLDDGGVALLEIALDGGDQRRGLHCRNEVIEEALFRALERRACSGLGLVVECAGLAGDVGSLQRCIQVVVDDLERARIGHRCGPARV